MFFFCDGYSGCYFFFIIPILLLLLFDFFYNFCVIFFFFAACSTVLVPARVVQALNLKLEDMVPHHNHNPRFNGIPNMENGKNIKRIWHFAKFSFCFLLFRVSYCSIYVTH